METDLEITEGDIWNGVPGDPFNCPIALAMKRHAKDNREKLPTVGGFRYQVTDEIKNFTKRFDSGEAMGPTKIKITFLEYDTCPMGPNGLAYRQTVVPR